MTDIKWEGEPLTISNSEIQVWKECRRRWYLTYYRELGLKAAEMVGPRRLGTKVHLALEVAYRDEGNPITVLAELYTEDEERCQTEEQIIALRKEHDLANAMVTGYLEWAAETGADDGLELESAEVVTEVESGVPGVRLRGKLDQRWSRKVDGARLFRDFKTVQELTTPAKLLPMDEQMKFYHLLEYLQSLQESGREPMWRTDGALYTMLRKVKRTANAKPPFYGQVEVHHNMTELRTFMMRVRKVIEEIVTSRQQMEAMEAAYEAGDKSQPHPHHYVFPPRPSRDCTWKCDFFAVCSMMDDGSNYEGLLAEYYTHIDPHERYNVVAEKEGSE